MVIVVCFFVWMILKGLGVLKEFVDFVDKSFFDVVEIVCVLFFFESYMKYDENEFNWIEERLFVLRVVVCKYKVIFEILFEIVEKV